MFGSGAVWGIDLGHAALKAVRMARSGGSLTVQAYESIDLSKIIPDAKASRDDRIRAAVQALITKHGLRSEKIVVSIPAKGVLSKFIQLPPVDRKKIPEMVKFEVKQHIPFDLKDVIWDYQPVRKEFPAGESVEVGLFAARRDLVQGALKFFEPVKSRLAGIQIAPLATYNFIKYDQKFKGAIGVIDMGAENTDLIILSEKGFWLRSLHVAGNNINRVLMEKFNIAFEEAEGIKRRIAESKYRKQIMEVIQPTFRELAMELDRSLGYYKSLYRDVKIERLLLMGGSIRIAGIEKFLVENLHYPIQRVNEVHTVSPGANVDKGAFLEALPGLGVALGLAIQGLNAGDITISLLPQEFVFEQEVERKKPWAIAAAVCLAAAIGVGYKGELDVCSQIAPELARLAGTDSILVKVEKQDKEYDAADKAVSFDRLDFLANAPNHRGVPRDLWLKLTQHISEIMPEEKVFFREIRSEVGDPDELQKKLASHGEGGAPATETGGVSAGEGGMAVGGGAAAAPPPPVPGGPEGKADLSKQRLCILFTVETEYSKQRGIEFMRQENLARLQGISQREDGKPLFKVAEMMNSREEVRDPLGNVYRLGTEAGQATTAEEDRAQPFEKERLKRLKEQRIRYLIVPIWCVVNSAEDYKALPDADSIDRVIDEVAKGDHDALPTSTLLSKKDSGQAVVQVKNNGDAAVLAYFSSGKRRRAIRVPGNGGIWHVCVDGGTYQIAIRSEKEGTKPLYGKKDLADGTAIGLEIGGGAGNP